MNPSGKPLSQRLLGLAGTAFLSVVLIYIAVQLIVSVWPVLVGVLGAVGSIGLTIWLIRRRQHNRYW